MIAVLKVISAGGGGSLQDFGRPGWKKFGVPAGGVMDRDSAIQANRLVGNSDSAVVLELCLTGARLLVLTDAEFAVTGAGTEGNRPRWRSFKAAAGDEIRFAEMAGGVWSYLAVRGGFEAPRWLGSASTNPRAGFGAALAPGDELQSPPSPGSPAVAGRFTKASGIPRFESEALVPVWAGPEWERFDADSRAKFLEQPWRISTQSDRTGYRLDGDPLASPAGEMLSSPLAVGAIQAPPSGQLLAILRDGPTVGGYPRIALIDPAAVSRFTQNAPGTKVRFELKT